MDAIELMKKEMLRRNYSLRTISTYGFCLRRFLSYQNKEHKKISKNDINDYLDRLIEKGACGNTININLNALKFLFEGVLHKRLTVNIKYSKVSKEMPIVLTKEEVIRLINSIENKKHKLMIELMYGAGLRVSELINLKVKDIEFENNHGWVRHGKGNKDRLFILPMFLRNELFNCIKEDNLEQDSWIFNSYNGHMSVRSVQIIVKKAANKAGIKKRVHCHTLRHSYATHLIENGYDVVNVQVLLGHNCVETTMRYVHMASPRLLAVKSPLDSLDLFNKEVNDSQLQKEDRKLSYEHAKTGESSLIDVENKGIRI